LLAGCGAAGDSGHSASSDKLIARTYNSGFELAHDTYNGMSVASDGRIYYVLSSESYEIGAQMYCYDPATDKIEHLGDLTEACGEKGAKTIAQGKSHVNFVERDGKLYFASEDNRKVKNLRAEPRCSVVFDEYTELWEELTQVMIEGRATRFLTKGAEFRKLRKAFYEKYMQYPTAGGGINEDDTVIVEVPNPGHPLGVRGVGEASIVPPPAAVANAIYRAVGVRMTELPMSPPRLLKAILSK